jgi:hypothetical protein
MKGAMKKWRWESGIAVALFLSLCFATVAFGQSSGAKNGQALGLGKLEPALEALDGSSIDPNAVAAVIVQFLGDEAIAGSIKDKQQLKLAAKAARKQILLDAGGKSVAEFDNLPFFAALVLLSMALLSLMAPEVPAQSSARMRPGGIRPLLIPIPWETRTQILS